MICKEDWKLVVDIFREGKPDTVPKFSDAIGATVIASLGSSVLLTPEVVLFIYFFYVEIMLHL